MPTGKITPGIKCYTGCDNVGASDIIGESRICPVQVITIETVTILLIAAVAFIAVCLISPRLVRVWKGEKAHHRQLEADRKAKEADYPD